MLGGVPDQEGWLHLEPVTATEPAHELPSFVLPDTPETALCVSFALLAPGSAREPQHHRLLRSPPKDRYITIMHPVPSPVAFSSPATAPLLPSFLYSSDSLIVLSFQS